ncbi:MAG: porin family protein [Prevotellaceae bacterium]|nr:porin family protein [Prevotellaceae bacterium]
MRKIFFLSIGFALSSGVQAKDCHHTADTTTVVHRLAADAMLHPLKPTYMKGALVASPWTDNWFVQVAGGTTVFLGTPLGCNDLFGRMKPAFSVSLGKWFTPSVGGRLNYGGMQINDCNNQSQDYQYMRADFMWNVLGNIYKDDVHSFARWSVIPYVGAGMLHNRDNGHKPFAVSYGIQGQYHLSRHIAVTAEIGSMTTMQDFDGYGKAHRLGDHLLSDSSVSLFISASQDGGVPLTHAPTSLRTNGCRLMPHPCLTKTISVMLNTSVTVRRWSSCARYSPSRDFWTNTTTCSRTMPLPQSQTAIRATITVVLTPSVRG